MAALRMAKGKGCRILSIVNVVGSTIANESDDVLYTWAGPEIAVASTKAYSTQLAVIYMIALYMADQLGTVPEADMARYMADLQRLPDLAEAALADKETIQYFASRYFNAHDMYFIGRNVDYAASLEASLKLKEISYIHSEAYTAGELKHGPISLLEDGTLVIAIATYEKLFDKMMSNVREVKARGAVVLGITVRGKEEDVYKRQVYQMVFTHLYTLLTNLFSTSTVASFGHMLVAEPLERVRAIFDKYEALFYGVMSIVLGTAAIMITPFIELYTECVKSISYSDIKLVILFVTIAILNSGRVPGVMLINAAGHYQKTQYLSLIHI